MDFVANDLSLSGQLSGLADFQRATAQLMSIRGAIVMEGAELYCHRNLQSARVTPQLVMKQAVQGLTREERGAFLAWLTKGPFWEDERQHGRDIWLESGGELVTDTAVGEVAYCRWQGLGRELVSFAPSSWLRTPVVVRWIQEGGQEEEIASPNHWELPTVSRSLAAQPRRIDSWETLDAHLRKVCSLLTFSDEAFVPLDGCPFALGAAERIQVLLRTLNRLRACVDNLGNRTLEGHRLYDDHFAGDKAWFSDSSDTEKGQFVRALTFRHPTNPRQTIFCPWHGKIKMQQLRIHFSWPVSANEPLYVVYIGPKRTKS